VTLLAGAIGVLVWVVYKSWAGVPVNADSISSWLVVAVAVGSIYAIAASGLVVTFTTSGVFNFAQGAIGMFMAFVYWELRFNHSLPTPIALFVSVVIVAPLLGALLERLIMRHLVHASLVVQIVVTVGVMLAFLGLAVTLWDPRESRNFPAFFDTSAPAFHIGTTAVTWHRLITIGVAIAIAVLLRLLLYRMRVGVTMRAVVDNRTLAGLHGARPEFASMLAWALGSAMAAISGILLAPELGLQVDALTLLIINAFAAAIIGRLRSLPLTYVGGLLIGLVVYFATNFLTFTGRFSSLQPNYVFPIALLFIALLLLPQARIELRRPPPPSRILQPRVAKVWETGLGMAAVWIAVFVISRDMGEVNLNRVTLAIVIAVLMLSLVPLTGWAGQVSLAQITFAGAGAFAMYKFAGSSGNPVGLLAAAAVAVPVGMLMALPAVRLQGLYLALASMAFAVMAESLFFDQPDVFGNGAQHVSRLSIFGYRFTDQRAFLLLATGLFGVLAVFIVWLRRTRYGRRLVALRDSEAACATLGVNRLTSKLSVYALSAAMAGFAGALLGMQRGTAATQDYTMLMGLPIVLLAVVGGVATVSGALFGGFAFILFRIITDTFDYSWLRSLERLGPGLLALSIATNPNGASVGLGFLFAPLLPWRKDARQEFKAQIRQRLRRGGPPPAPGGPAEPVTEAPVPAGAPAAAPRGGSASVGVPSDETKL
jgi:branched-chain amino acid transport system permease protein